MKASIYLKVIRYCIICTFFLWSCEKNDQENQMICDGYYAGTFELKDSPGISDSVFLSIENGYFFCSTSLPFNYGAGRIEAAENTVFFTDTLFFPIPAVYLTGFSLSGEYTYAFDGVNLKLEKTEQGNILYRLKRIENQKSLTFPDN